MTKKRLLKMNSSESTSIKIQNTLTRIKIDESKYYAMQDYISYLILFCQFLSQKGHQSNKFSMSLVKVIFSYLKPKTLNNTKNGYLAGLIDTNLRTRFACSGNKKAFEWKKEIYNTSIFKSYIYPGGEIERAAVSQFLAEKIKKADNIQQLVDIHRSIMDAASHYYPLKIEQGWWRRGKMGFTQTYTNFVRTLQYQASSLWDAELLFIQRNKSNSKPTEIVKGFKKSRELYDYIFTLCNGRYSSSQHLHEFWKYSCSLYVDKNEIALMIPPKPYSPPSSPKRIVHVRYF